MYKEELLEIYSEKPNYGKLKGKTHEVRQKNLICDDEITIELKIKNDKIIDARFHGVSCFVTTVSASLLTDKIKGMKIEEVLKLGKEDLEKILGTKFSTTRLRCQLLPLEALKKLQIKIKKKCLK